MYMPKRSRPSTPSSPGAAGGRARIATPSPIPVTPERQSPVYASFGASAPSRPSRPTRTVAATAPVDPLPPIVPALPAMQPTPSGSAAPSPAPSSGPPTPTHGGRQGFKLKHPQYSMPTKGALRGGINWGDGVRRGLFRIGNRRIGPF